MREFRIKVNNEKTYVVKANDYNQAVKTLHSKLRDFDDTKKNINVVREFITNNGGKFSKSKDADAILDFIYKKTGVKNADYGDVLYIVRNYTNVKVEDTAVTDYDLTNFLALKRSLELRIGEEIDFDKLEEYVNKLPKDKNGKKNVDVKEVIKCCVKDSSIDTAQGEIEVLKSFGFDYKDGKWVKESNSNDIIVQPDYHYVSIIGPDDTEKHCKKYQYQSAGMLKKIIASNIKDSSIKDDLTMVETYKKSIIYIDDNGYYYHTPIGGRGAKAQKDNTKDINIVKKRIDNDYSFLYDSSIKDVDWDFANKLKQHSQEEIRNALKYSAPTVYKQYRNGETIQFAGLAGQLTGPEKTKVLKRLGDSNITDAEPVKVEKIIRKEKSALGITYYLFQTKSNSGATIYYEVTDKTYHGEPTYSGGGVISFSLKTANDSLDSHLLSDKLKAKYGEKEGTKRYLRGENDSAINDMAETDMSMLQQAKRVPAHNIYYNRVSYDDLKRTINKVMEEGNDKDVVNILIGQLSELRKDYEADIKNSKLDKEETKRHYGEYKRLVNNYKNSHISKEYTNAVNSFLSAIKDSNNIKNRKSYTIKVGDKQYKIFAESEEEAINKYIKSKKQ